MKIHNKQLETAKNQKLTKYKQFEPCSHSRIIRFCNIEGGIAEQCAYCKKIINVILWKIPQ